MNSKEGNKGTGHDRGDSIDSSDLAGLTPEQVKIQKKMNAMKRALL